ncbi:Eukaryotic translation initiation factor 3 subunit E [Hypsibius exemplaris]|uniref:Eukaryotic translation initiation factor 3 subunit E n=1 Tax=Hypsibius exemplaris TaxID=2072580 RepID=A0A9X6RL55_HYPEX|nr:Eukaryotic translation initiation factor 3 subunit E [Hypsibius exemplaris]
MAQYDLTPTLSKFFDRHLIIPLLEFLGGRGIYDADQIRQSRIDIMKETKMVDYIISEYVELTGDQDSIPAELLLKREEVLKGLNERQQETEQILGFFQADDVKVTVENSNDSDELYNTLVRVHEFKPEMLDTIYDWAKFNFECGNYKGATEYLDLFRSVAPTNHAKQRPARWGKAAGEILLQEWDTALADLNQLKADIDNSVDRVPITESLNDRAWLIHWSLYVFFNHPKGKDLIVDWCMGGPDYLNAIQTLCPHILRYLVVAILTNRRRRHVIKDVIEIIKQEAPNYKDPVTEFVISLFVEYDFDKSQKQLKECEIVLENDFFLVGCVNDFIDSARQYIFETYCRIHSRISIPVLAETLHLNADEAEKWIANVIRNARLDAKIDAAKGEVLMGIPALSSYQMLIEKTKTLALRTQQMVNQVDKRVGGRTTAGYQEARFDGEQKAALGY